MTVDDEGYDVENEEAHSPSLVARLFVPTLLYVAVIVMRGMT